MQKFTGGGGSGGSGGSSSDLVSLAMAEASKLFDSAGGSAGGSKQDAINSAGMTIMKMVVQSKLGGGGNSGGMGGLMSMVSSPPASTFSSVHTFVRLENSCEVKDYRIIAYDNGVQ